MFAYNSVLDSVRTSKHCVTMYNAKNARICVINVYEKNILVTIVEVDTYKIKYHFAYGFSFS